MFQINPALDVDELARQFAADRRLHIADFLADDAAARLHDHCRKRTDWVQVLNSEQKVVELSREIRASLTMEQAAQLDNAVYAGARYGFQYRYESLRVPDPGDERDARDDLLAQFVAWMSGGAARDFLRHIIGQPGVDFADGQATAYSPGDFLTAHDDAVAGKNRFAAYVFGLNPEWRPEWGGLLLFHDAGSCRVDGLVPSFNCLNLFAVPQPHSVSEVSRSTPVRRYSITGWLRSSK